MCDDLKFKATSTKSNGISTLRHPTVLICFCVQGVVLMESNCGSIYLQRTSSNASSLDEYSYKDCKDECVFSLNGRVWEHCCSTDGLCNNLPIPMASASIEEVEQCYLETAPSECHSKFVFLLE